MAGGFGKGILRWVLRWLASPIGHRALNVMASDREYMEVEASDRQYMSVTVDDREG